MTNCVATPSLLALFLVLSLYGNSQGFSQAPYFHSDQLSLMVEIVLLVSVMLIPAWLLLITKSVLFLHFLFLLL